MITPNNPQYNPLFATIVNNRNWASGVQDLARGWAKPLMLVDALNPSGSYSIEGPDGQLRVAFQPRQEVVATVATVTQSGPNLVVTWVDPTYAAFREKMIVRDSNGNQAYVLASTPGSVTLAPATNPTALLAASHFVAGRSVLEMGSGSGNHYSTGVTNLYKENSVRYNWTAVNRESFTMSRREKFISYKFDETFYSYTQGELDMIQRFMKNKVKNMFYSEPGQFVSPTEGTVNRYEGLRAAVRNQGGSFTSSTSLLTTAQFEALLDFMAINDPAQEQNYLWIGGRRAWAQINNLYGGTNIQFTVSKAVINGNELNFDITKATINGVTVNFMVMSIFDDVYSFPTLSTIAGAGYKESNTFCILNLNPVPNKLGGMIPSVRKFHFGSSDLTGGAETLYRYIPGMVGPGTTNSTGGGMLGGYQMAASSTDGGQFEILEDAGVDFTADACVWWELAA